jgi:hypothetical protein
MRLSGSSAVHPSRRRLVPVSARRFLVAAATGALLVPTLMTGVAAASGITGEPQPDAAPFTIAATSSNGSSVVASDGSLVVVYDVGNTTKVCRILRGGRKCTSVATLTPLAIDADDDFGTPQVFAPAPGQIVVLQNTCCATDENGTLLYTSTDFGKIFDAGTRVGSLGVDAATTVGGNVVWTQGDDHSGLEVESSPVAAPSGVPQPSQLVESSVAAYDVGIGHVKGGVLLGVDDLTSAGYATTVRFAPMGSNPGAAASYGVIGSFPDERLIAISGDAVLTDSTTGTSPLKLRIFNGTSFTAPSIVPGSKGGGPEWFGLDVDPSGLAHVFIDTSRHSYIVFQVTTRDAVKWSGADFLGDAVATDGFSAAIDHAGTGILFGSDGKPTIFPILAPQSVTVSLSAASIAVGGHSTLSGKVSPKLSGRPVQLQLEKAGKWYAAASTTEASSGKFAFTITGAAAGTTAYRAVVKGVPGHYLYGYSGSVKLTVT